MEADMDLKEARAQIDTIDPKLKELLMKRLDCSYQVAEAKNEAGEMSIYRADREAEILERLSKGVPKDRLDEYLAVVRKIMEVSRMYQYGLLFDWNPDAFSKISEGVEIPKDCKSVKIRVKRGDYPNAMSSILSMIGDYGYNMDRMELIEENGEDHTVTFELTIRGDLNRKSMQVLMFQLSGECLEFQILGCR